MWQRFIALRFAIIKKHTTYGKQLLEKATDEVLKLSATIAYEHHERFDGSGYNGMKSVLQQEVYQLQTCLMHL